MTKVKVLQTIPYFAEVGDVIELPDCDAPRWIACGTAELAEPVDVEVPAN